MNPAIIQQLIRALSNKVYKRVNRLIEKGISTEATRAVQRFKEVKPGSLQERYDFLTRMDNNLGTRSKTAKAVMKKEEDTYNDALDRLMTNSRPSMKTVIQATDFYVERYQHQIDGILKEEPEGSASVTILQKEINRWRERGITEDNYDPKTDYHFTRAMAKKFRDGGPFSSWKLLNVENIRKENSRAAEIFGDVYHDLTKEQRSQLWRQFERMLGANPLYDSNILVQQIKIENTSLGAVVNIDDNGNARLNVSDRWRTVAAKQLMDENHRKAMELQGFEPATFTKQ